MRDLYEYVGGNVLRDTDPYGLLWVWGLYDLPATRSKCATVLAIMGFYSTPTDEMLLDWWVSGKKRTRTIDMDSFDTGGGKRRDVWDSVRRDVIGWARNMRCGETKTILRTQKRPGKANAVSRIKMISQYMFWSNCDYTLTKRCGACGGNCRVDVRASCNFHAWDKVEFWPNPPNLQNGKYIFGYGGLYIADRLVRACVKTGRGFDLVSSSAERKSWRVPCR